MSETNIPDNLDSERGQSPQFKQTHWSLVRRAASFDSPESREALEISAARIGSRLRLYP
jgi:hypothetical protein